MNLKRWIAMLLVAALLATAAPALAAPSYYVTVDLTNQIVTVYQAGNVSKSGIVRQMICSGQLTAKKQGRDNYVYLSSVKERLNNPPKPGRPRKSDRLESVAETAS